MSIKYKLLIFETLTVLFNLVFSIVTISFILDNRTHDYLSKKNVVSTDDFVDHIGNFNKGFHKSMNSYLEDEENISSFNFLVSNFSFKKSERESLSSLYYRIIKK